MDPVAWELLFRRLGQTMNPIGLLPVNLMSLASVAFGLWMFFTSAHYRKTLDGKFEVWLPKDGSCIPGNYFEAKDRLRLQLRYDGTGGLRRRVGGREVRSDEELMAAIDQGRDPDLNVPVGIDALLDMSWGEIVRTMGLCKRRGFRVELVAPIEVSQR